MSDIKEKLKEMNEELEELNEQAHRYEKQIAENVSKLMGKK